jgi:hypothetical protein
MCKKFNLRNKKGRKPKPKNWFLTTELIFLNYALYRSSMGQFFKQASNWSVNIQWMANITAWHDMNSLLPPSIHYTVSSICACGHRNSELNLNKLGNSTCDGQVVAG